MKTALDMTALDLTFDLLYALDKTTRRWRWPDPPQGIARDAEIRIAKQSQTFRTAIVAQRLSGALSDEQAHDLNDLLERIEREHGARLP